MSVLARKFVALFLMLWLPLFSMSAVAMVACPHGADTSMHATMAMSGEMDMSVMADMDAADHSAHMQHGADHSHPAPGQSSHDCGQCGVCHIACSPGLVSTAAQVVVDLIPADSLPVNTHFLSITLPIFDPPPLVRI